MKNKLVVILFSFLFLISAHSVNAIFSTSTNEIFGEVIDDATETIKNEVGEYAKEKVDGTTQKISNKASQTITQIAKKIPGKVLDALKFISRKTVDIVRGSMNAPTRDWFSERKDLTMEGLREERAEFEGDVERMLLKFWERVKNSIKRDKKE